MERVTGASMWYKRLYLASYWYINISHWLKCTSPTAICVYNDKGSGVCKYQTLYWKALLRMHIYNFWVCLWPFFCYLNIKETWAAKGTHVSLNTNLCIIKTNKNPLEWVCLYLIVMCLANSLDLGDCRHIFVVRDFYMNLYWIPNKK